MSKLAGKWNVVTKSALGTNNAVWTFAEKEDGTWGGTLSSEDMTTEWASIKVDGDDFELDISLQLPFGLIPFNMKGTVEDDETIGGTSKMKMGKSKFKGKKVG